MPSFVWGNSKNQVNMKKANASKKRKKRKPSKMLILRISHTQNASLLNYCKINGITPNKLIKKELKTYLHDFTDEKIGHKPVDKKQLSLFQEPEVSYKQLTIFNSEG